MKAIIYSEYGSPENLQLADVEKPTPKANEALVKIRAVSINGADWEGLVGRPLYARMGGLRRPSSPILGSDIAGTVEAVGEGVTLFKPGDAVYGETLRYHDGFAEYVCVLEKGLALKPPGITFEQASTIPQGGVIALQGLRDQGQVRPGQHILINGAGGSAGLFAVQLAKFYGAEVTGVDNAGKVDYLRQLGADHVVDYAREDYTRQRGRYDLILDVIAKRSVFAVQRALKPGGKYLVVGGSVGVFLQLLLWGPLIRRITGKSVRLLIVRPNRTDYETVTRLCEEGTIIPVIDRTYPLSSVSEAMRYVGEGRAKGKVVIVVE
jgi:NADPH:quinone reductase-like Zn-dependent oxidoreductase